MVQHCHSVSWRWRGLAGLFMTLSVGVNATGPAADPENAGPRCTAVAQIIQVSGQVSVKPAGKVVRVTPAPLPFDLCVGDEVATVAGMARLATGQYRATLDTHSRLRVSPQGSTLDAGKTLFEVRKQGPASGVQITTRLAVIGVKGTTFLVSDDGREVGVAMDSGVVEITSTQGPVGLYRENTTAPAKTTVEDDYARFVREREQGVAALVAEREQGVAALAAEYATWKAAREREFVAYVENLQLAARRELLTQTGIAVERDLSATSGADIARLRAF